MADQKKLYATPEEPTPIAAPLVAEIEKTEQAIVKEETKPKVELDKWIPKTALGRKVKSREITDIKQILDKGIRIREAEVVDRLLPNMESDFIFIGQAHGKFGGGKRRLIKQTQKKTAEGNKPTFTSMAVVGNGDGYFGVGLGGARESMPSREKATRAAKTNIMQIVRGCGSWKCGCGEPHSLPFEVEGRAGSVRVKFMPAPKGAGLVTDDEIKKLLKAAGYKDVWSKSWGQTRKKINFIHAAVNALAKVSAMKVMPGIKVKHGTLSA